MEMVQMKKEGSHRLIIPPIVGPPPDQFFGTVPVALQALYNTRFYTLSITPKREIVLGNLSRLPSH